MNAVWTLSDIDFCALWEETNAGWLPSPLCAVSRIMDADEYHAQQLRALREVRAIPGLDVDLLGKTLAHPDITVEAISSGTLDDGEDDLVRIHAARRGPHGVVVRQIPGEEPCYSDGFVVTFCTAVELARVVVAQLPGASPGRLGNIVLVGEGEGLDYSYGRSAVRNNAFAAESASARAARFLDAPIERIGNVGIAQARSAFGPKGCTRYSIPWRDLADDGRYLITDENPPVAVPADAEKLLAQINTRIAAVVQALRDERPA
ncbi:ESX secretion-associated protein EspG [Nocardia sp. NEAU-G5]|uniref:ESX secretion-associated protein EspG n=1 Tax=Nocardia albiluteola TaxID=2842303 RepID=A0ABS6AY37_9NOCA|nr:ESX secretion-associated protein EspG [Nocardia albiluteola]MBU3062967.1 ESX secretion-associated protein EspG [Nocardia albiluteola]